MKKEAVTIDLTKEEYFYGEPPPPPPQISDETPQYTQQPTRPVPDVAANQSIFAYGILFFIMLFLG